MGNHIVEINLSPKKIVVNEPRVLVDTSGLPIHKNFTNQIYEARFYKEINFSQLCKAKKRLENALELLELPNVKIIKETVDELANFSDIISKKAKNLNDHEKNVFLKIKYTRNLDESHTNKEIFNKICLLSYKLMKKAREKIYKPENELRYNALVDVIRLITEKIKLKKLKTIPEWWEKKIIRREYKDLCTDEKFVAALFNSAFEQPLAGLSKDGDIRRIFNICYGLIASEDLLPYNEPLINALQKNPITLYTYSFRLTRWESIKTDKLWTEPEFIIRNVSEKESIEVRAKVVGELKKAFPLEEKGIYLADF